MINQPKSCFEVLMPTSSQVNAIKAVYKGEADSNQQRVALGYICNELCRTQEGQYMRGSFDETAFLNGRAFVGTHILNIINVPIGRLALTQTEEKPHE